MLLFKIKVIEEMRLRGERRTGLTEAFQEGNQKEFSAEILLIMRQRGRQEKSGQKGLGIERMTKHKKKIQ